MTQTYIVKIAIQTAIHVLHHQQIAPVVMLINSNCYYLTILVDAILMDILVILLHLSANFVAILAYRAQDIRIQVALHAIQLYIIEI